jgi:23S rRNA pseudouridine955/2504/2580 synthase
MRSILIGEKQAGKRIDKAIRELFPSMPVGAMYKAFRNKDVKVNGIRIKEEYILSAGDKLDLYIIDGILDGIPQNSDHEQVKDFSVVYEDSNILIVNKAQGLPVHPDKEQSADTLIDTIKTYLSEKGEYNPSNPSDFPPSLCHRIDRNTGGLVVIAKNSKSFEILLDKIKNREIKKYYQCLVVGKMEKASAELKAYLFKDKKNSRVFISDNRVKYSLEIITRYKVISFNKGISKLEVELVTGRTHQIRAHLAFIGHPIVGDGKYGSNAFNRSLGIKQQALWAYKLNFDFKNAGILNYLEGKTFEVLPEFPEL